MITSINLLFKKEDIKMKLGILGYSSNCSGIKRFQKENGLPISGIVDNLTYKALKRLFAED